MIGEVGGCFFLGGWGWGGGVCVCGCVCVWCGGGVGGGGGMNRERQKLDTSPDSRRSMQKLHSDQLQPRKARTFDSPGLPDGARARSGEGGWGGVVILHFRVRGIPPAGYPRHVD